MYVLYYRPTCPYSKKVLKVIKELGLGIELRDIAEGCHAEELKKRGGKQQVPYLIDRKNKVEMYESDDIVAYLKGKPLPQTKDVSQGICVPAV